MASTNNCWTRLTASGKFFFSHTKLKDQLVLRVAIGNLRTTEAHVAGLWDVLVEKSRQLSL